MAQPYVTGPAPIFIAVPPALGATPIFLGHAERTPTIQFRPRYSSLFVDLGGHEIPFDLVKQGADAIVSIDMTRFNEPAYNALQGCGSHLGSNFGDLGSLMMTENLAYPLWIPWPYTSLHPAMSNQNPGYHFFRAVCVNDDIQQIGTVPRRQRLIWHCIRQFGKAPPLVSYNQTATAVATAATDATYGFCLADFDMSAVAGLMNPVGVPLQAA